MSIICCEDCSHYLDTDAHPEVWREEFDDAPLCDPCFEDRLDLPATPTNTTENQL